MVKVFWVGVAGGCGAIARWGVTLLAERLAGPGFPWGTITVNILGSFLLGFLIESAARGAWSQDTKLVLGTGFLGAFTTFSTFSVETVRLYEAGKYWVAAGNALGNLTLAIGGAAMGIWVARTWLAQ